MKKKYMMFLLVFIITLGYAAVTTTLDIIGKTNIAYNEEDFRVEITNLKINDSDNINLISKDKQSFTFIGSGNDILNYTVTNYSYQYDVKINLICNPSEGIEIEQIGELKGQSKENRTITSTSKSEVTCTINIEKISRTEYAEDMCKVVEGQEWTFDYTGSEQEFIVPCDGEYKIELWGAQGGGKGIFVGGLGAYTKGNIHFMEAKKIYLIIGGKGNLPTSSTNIIGGYNGGGGTYGSPTGSFYYNIAGTGGGATDVRIAKSTTKYDNVHKTYISNNTDLFSRIMVAAGGGGGTNGDIDGWKSTGYGAAGGGLIGYNGFGTYYGEYKKTMGGTQTAAGAGQIVTTNHAGPYVNAGFGYGGAQGWAPWGGGGGGYYGGGSGGGWSGAGAGGSSFISGHNGCDAISKSSTETNIIHTGNSVHYSGLKFKNTVMIDGAGYSWTNVKGTYTGMPSHDGKSTMTGNSGHGYAKITYLGK